MYLVVECENWCHSPSLAERFSRLLPVSAATTGGWKSIEYRRFRGRGDYSTLRVGLYRRLGLRKAALRQSVLQSGERKSEWELVKAAQRSNSQSRRAMRPDLWAREPEAARATGMER